MKLIQLDKSQFKSCENTVTKKILINICDYLIYGLTDTNHFYRNWYVDPKRDYESNDHSLGTVIYSKPLSYHIIANMVCVQLPKTSYNLQPFKLNYFKKCCDNLASYIQENDVKEIHAPVFGTKILEGDWKCILSVMREIFENSSLERICIYD